ncbi:hypothetical protein AXF42_Ash020339 [Apostasia shenzhenica]|uniref:Uncharacterized protein n=1 Tax=Apostasia shenzhenica TaxID=1088818 RepID=A0A2I0B0M9_9ASPA|nr:hypothetical protein AXF42_Ash020339 [Apostasia shenzhenica]
MGPLVVATQVATGLSVVAGAMLMFGGGGGSGSNDRRERCATCNGTGRVSCVCSRWSDGDAGCRTCAGSGRMACSSCRGSGTGRPAPVRLSVRSNRPSNLYSLKALRPPPSHV